MSIRIFCCTKEIIEELPKLLESDKKDKDYGYYDLTNTRPDKLIESFKEILESRTDSILDYIFIRFNQETLNKLISKNWNPDIIYRNDIESKIRGLKIYGHKFLLLQDEKLDYLFSNYKNLLGWHFVYRHGGKIPKAKKTITHCAICNQPIYENENHYSNGEKRICISCKIDFWSFCKTESEMQKFDK